MECNREEAMRAKGIAESKMLNKDFTGARKIVLKAQKLYPDLENVLQMLTVCEVHCSAENKINGEIDWYGILQVIPTADELTIKKQYRKLALLLHPDKNKFGGAEAAFKLVGEAHRTLTDKSKRVLHDMKRGVNFRTVSARQPAPHVNRSSLTKKQPGVASSSANGASTQSNNLNHQQSPPFSSNQTFWTICTSCGIRYQYYQNIMNRSIRCQSCKQPFIAYDLSAHSVPSAAPWNYTEIPQKENKPSAAHCAAQRSNFGTGSNMDPRGNVGGGFGGGPHKDSNKDLKSDRDGGTANDAKFEKVKLHETSKKEQTRKPPARSRSQKRGRKAEVESIESESSDSDVIVKDGCPSGQNTGTRRSTRQKQNISYNEEKSDDDNDFMTPKNKKLRPEGMSVNEQKNASKFWEGNANGVIGQSTGAESKVSSDSPDTDSFSYPDPEFYNFEEERDESKFSADQIWAIYDNLDALPRFYALIRQVYSPKFRLRFNWLEYEPSGKAETLWYRGNLPIGCGSFKLGKSEHTQERLMFSHLMPLRKGTKKNTYEIFPRKSEVWALFKNWDIKWSSCSDIDRQYEYEVVEVVSDLTESDAISVVRLVRIQGFVSLFVQSRDDGSSPLRIQMKDILQFSHKVPSYRLKGSEREGVPKGSMELDCASLPLNFAETFPSISLENSKAKTEDLNSVCDNFPSDLAGEEEGPNCSSKCGSELDGVAFEELKRGQNHVESEQIGTEHAQDAGIRKPAMNNNSQPSSSPQYEYPDSEFHYFEEEKSTDKFEEGQIWALYSDLNKNPNYYGLITKVESESFRVHVTWLEGYCEREQEVNWYKRELPVGCGAFKTVEDGFVSDTTDTFSHLVHSTNKGNDYVIYPQLGQIWAIYKNWSFGWSFSDVESCEFDLVEIVAVSSSGFKVLVLSKVNGYSCVFTGKGRGIPSKIVDIPISERLKFSHRIPAFRLTEERGGKLRGCWELDPASVPDILLFANS
ncbi:uncharacterized protein A4U43_C05F1140 [Asparagus officinalis]|uniref:J domain-containing protein n=1 Tax=Asparagus officinalis TaxID=4686 RepID=A0A5P1EP38_ASPOF|nr:uncharacterized protein LOC109839958 [Asparagus officinalis]ONK67544.1 uncharacterized protein A4U43_C05F1140 [Asparagus officinalis]